MWMNVDHFSLSKMRGYLPFYLRFLTFLGQFTKYIFSFSSSSIISRMTDSKLILRGWKRVNLCVNILFNQINVLIKQNSCRIKIAWGRVNPNSTVRILIWRHLFLNLEFLVMEKRLGKYWLDVWNWDVFTINYWDSVH